MSSRRTSAEQGMAELLDKMGVEYEEQVKVEGHKVDFLVEGRLVVEANGDWWHSTEMWKKTDAKKLTKWKEAGVVFVGVWESRVKKEPALVEHCLWRLLKDAGYEPAFWDWAVDPP